MLPRSLVAPLVAILLIAGCAGPGDRADAASDLAAEGSAAEVDRIEWDGHIVHGALDPLGHMRDPEGVIFPVHQTGFLVEIVEVPTAIEVSVSWDAADASFVLHPHYKASDDAAPGGETLYYGYLSERFTESPGCIRIPGEDMAAGTWPMMVHPSRDMAGVDYTITVAIEGAQGHVLDDRHGHRSDGPSPVEDHGIEECLLPPTGVP